MQGIERDVICKQFPPASKDFKFHLEGPRPLVVVPTIETTANGLSVRSKNVFAEYMKDSLYSRGIRNANPADRRIVEDGIEFLTWVDRSRNVLHSHLTVYPRINLDEVAPSQRDEFLTALKPRLPTLLLSSDGVIVFSEGYDTIASYVSNVEFVPSAVALEGGKFEATFTNHSSTFNYKMRSIKQASAFEVNVDLNFAVGDMKKVPSLIFSRIGERKPIEGAVRSIVDLSLKVSNRT